MTEHTIATALTKAQKAHKRKAADFYPTPPDVTRALMDFLAIGLDKVVLEPACGDGSMSRVIEGYGNRVLSSDLRDGPEIYGLPGRDFISPESDAFTGVDWIITNPPFNLAEAFIRKALSITPNVAMLLSNQYWHSSRRRDLFEQRPPAFVLPLLWRPAFLEKERGSSPMMNVMWVVWNTSTDTRYRLLSRPRAMSPFEDLL